jgi:hypothetical protein
MAAASQLVGKQFFWLIVEERCGSSKHGKALWKCRCKCGGITYLDTGRLISGNTKSCGCYDKELKIQRNFKHGFASRATKHHLYGTWTHIIDRTCNPNCKDYPLYGGIGIKMCNRWRNSFPNFVSDILSEIGDRPEGMSIDRFPNKLGNYEPGNVRWGTDEMQANNKTNNRLLEFNGKTQTVMQWSREVKIHVQTLLYRLKHGYSVERALTEPTHK